MRANNRCLIAGSLLVFLAPLLGSEARAQRSGVEIWSQSCGNCHVAQPAIRYTAEHWESLVMHMRITARLPDTEADAILEFLKSGAKRVAKSEPASGPTELARLASLDPSVIVVESPGGEELYKRQCAACHGDAGKGNGPAAMALSPKPKDLTNPERMNQFGDEELLEIITNGKGTMPAFGALLRSDELKEVMAYVRSLSTPKNEK